MTKSEPRLPDDDPTGVRHLLSSLSDPGPMPDDLVARIRADLEAEAGRGVTAAAGHPPVDLTTGRRPHPVLWVGVAAAAVLVLAVGAMSTMNGWLPGLVTAGGSNDVASMAQAESGVADGADPADGQQARASAQEEDRAGQGADEAEEAGTSALVPEPTMRLASTDEAVTASTAVEHAQNLLLGDATNPASSPLVGSRLFDPDAAAACATAVMTSTGTEPADLLAVLAVDLVRFDGEQTVMLVLRGSRQVTAYVVRPTCGRTSADLVAGPFPLT